MRALLAAAIAAGLLRKQQNPPAVPTGTVAAAGCPGTPTCSDHGDCLMDQGTCMCEAGFAGSDCGGEAPMFLEVTNIAPAELQDALGMYRLDSMYLYVLDHPAGDFAIKQSTIPSQVKWLHYDHGSKGWALSKFNSSCIDDICFFAYNQDPKPPTFGYVYGGPELHVYHSQILFDQATHKVSNKLGYDYLFAFTPDPTVPSFGMEEFNGRYLLQPRYTHVNTKYAIFPISFDAPMKNWVLSGLLGEPRKRRIIVQAQDPSENRYIPPSGPWEPAEMNFQLRPACMNHVGDMACMHLADICPLQDSDGDWVRKCCRQTCGSCQESRASCPLSQAHNVLGSASPAFMQEQGAPPSPALMQAIHEEAPARVRAAMPASLSSELGDQ